MTKEVLLAVKGLQLSPENEEEAVEMIAPGEYYFRNGKRYILYDEVSEGQKDVTRNIVKFAPDYMEITKKGITNVHMVFEKNKKNITYYTTPYGSLLIGIDASKIEISETEDTINCDVEYGLDINYEYVANCHITMVIKAKGNRDFKIAD